jgi:predicted TIM-barrel fold metal-dependent hydrolase
MWTPITPTPHLAREIARAANDWTSERWLSVDERLRALILVPNQVIDDAVAEIHRVAPRRGMAGILMAANGLSKPFGHPLYHPIYEAAAEWDLPVVFHSGGDALSETLSHTAAGGHPATYGEFHMFRPQAMMTHLTSLITQGVFAKCPDLRVLLVGAGFAWVPSLFWRFDTEYNAYRRETPWVKAHPSEYLRKHVRISTYPVDIAPTPGHLQRMLNAFGGFEDLLVYASGYPNWDTDAPEDVMGQLPEDWRRKVLHDNALELFRWEAPERPTTSEPAEATVGAMD